MGAHHPFLLSHDPYFSCSSIIMFTRTLALCALLHGSGANAQVVLTPDEGQPFVFGIVHELNSIALGQKRTLNIYLPDGYADSTLRYPVIYVLDGSANEDFPHIAGLVQFMNMYELLPKSIVVGIANEGRSRYHDFTHVTNSDSDKVWIPTGGGSADFITFIEKEVQPFVAMKYRTSGTRTIIGQSLGGLLVMEILFRKPALFDDYIAVSPSLWWDDGSLAESATEWARTHASPPKRMFIAMAADDDWGQPGVDKIVAALHAHPGAITWMYEPFPKETHATILHRAAYRAFEWMTSGK